MIHPIALTDTADPFAEVLQSLKTSLASVQPIVTPIMDVETICNDLSMILDYANDVPATLTACQEALEALSALCQALIEIPFVDVVAEMAAGICEDAVAFLTDINKTISAIIKEIVSPCKKVFDDLAKAFKEAVNVISTIATTIPDYLNTVQILSYGLDIAQDIYPVLAGTSASATTKKFISDMVLVRDDIAKVMQPLSDFVSGIADVVKVITTALGSKFKKIQSTMKTVQSGLGEFENVVKPIKEAFDAIENAIAPVKWVLDAVKSLIEKILKPVVEAVLKATGINALLQPLLDQIEKSLGVKPLFDLLQANVSESSSTQWQKKGGTQAVSAGSSAWSGLASNLSQYNCRDKGNTYQLIMKMVDALTGSPSGPGPFSIPDWPETPSISGLPQTAGAGAANDAQFNVDNNLFNAPGLGSTYRRTVRQRKMAECYAAMKLLSQPATSLKAVLSDASSPLWVTDVLLSNNVIKANYDDVGLPNVTKLLQAAAQAKQSLQDAQTIGPQLVINLQAYDNSRELPEYFQEEMQDFSSLFSDGVKVMDFLVGFDWAAGIFKDFEQAFKDQADAASNAYAKAKVLLQSSQDVDAAISNVEAHEPTKQQFTNALQYIDQIAGGAAGLGNTLRRGLALDAKLKNQFSERLTTLQAQVNTDADAALKQMEAIHKTVTTAMAHAGEINSYLTTYASKFTQLGKDASSVSADALPGLSKGVQLCNTIASILDPLSCILEEMNCKANNPTMSAAGLEVSAFKSGMQGIISQQNQTVINAFDFVAGKVVPTAKIAADVEDISNFVSTQAAPFKSATNGLSSSFDTLKSSMAPTKTFDYQRSVCFKASPPISIGPDGKATGGGQMVTKQVNQKVANFFVDAAFKQTVIQLITDMNDAADKAGLVITE